MQLKQNIPIPLRATRFDFPWSTMQIGDSIDIPKSRRPSLAVQFKAKGWGFVSSSKGTPEFPLADGLVRVWRDVDTTPVSEPVVEEVLDNE